MVTRFSVRPGSDEVGDNAMDNSLNEEIDEGGILLNHAKAGPFSLVAKALHHIGS